jgi:predicted SAM-dependent methyltransferase
MALALGSRMLPRIIVEYLKRYRAPRDNRIYLATHPIRKLNIGCGSNIVSGWLNVDSAPSPGAIYLDGRKPWPYQSNIFAAVLAEHVIEHVPKEDGMTLLTEAYRVLKPGGHLRVVTPDLTFLMRLTTNSALDARAYLAAIANVHSLETLTTCDAINLAFYSYGHRYIYSSAELRTSLERTGFVDIIENRAGDPIHEIFAGAEGHGSFIGEEINAQEAFALEAKKP